MRSRRTPTPVPTATAAAGRAAEPLRDVPRHVLGRLRTLVGDEAAPLDHDEPVGSATAPLPTVEPATAAPLAGHGTEPLAVRRCFAFVDICGFTSFCDREGERAAIDLLTHFRSVTRAVAARRGVRVAKWLGDGVMLVATDPAPLAATVVELVVRVRSLGLDTHAGMAGGPVLLFEGDDYVGRPVNLAARLCDSAGPAEVLVRDLGPDLPDWVHARPHGDVELAGMGRVVGVQVLVAAPEVQADLAAGAPTAGAGSPAA